MSSFGSRSVSHRVNNRARSWLSSTQLLTMAPGNTSQKTEAIGAGSPPVPLLYFHRSQTHAAKAGAA